MKRIVVFILIIFLLSGCTSKKEQLICEIGDTVITIEIQNGKIIKYIDKITGEASKEMIDVLNENHLTDITTNKEALEILKKYIIDNDGEC